MAMEPSPTCFASFLGVCSSSCYSLGGGVSHFFLSFESGFCPFRVFRNEEGPKESSRGLAISTSL